MNNLTYGHKAILFLSSILLFAITTGQSYAIKHPFNRRPTGQEKPEIQKEALILLKQNQEAMQKLRTYQAECRIILTRTHPKPGFPAISYELSVFKAEKPDKMKYLQWRMDKDPRPRNWAIPDAPADRIFASDGKRHLRQYGDFYSESTVTPEKIQTGTEPWIGFYTVQDSLYSHTIQQLQSNQLVRSVLEGKESIEGVPCDKIAIKVVAAADGHTKDEQNITYWLGPDKLIRRCMQSSGTDDPDGITFDHVIHNIKTNLPIPPSEYSYSPPPSVTRRERPGPRPLLPTGTMAPDFSASNLKAKSVKLSDYRGQVVVLDFWASWCGPCKASMPHAEAMIKRLKSEGLPVVLIAVDDLEDIDYFREWVKRNDARYPDLNFVYIDSAKKVGSQLYKIDAVPTQYVLDKNGIIRAAFTGFDGSGASLETAIRAASK